MKLARLICSALLILSGISAMAQSSPTISLNLGQAQAFNCGRFSTPTYCYGLPITLTDDDGKTDGSIWIDQQSNGSGFILFVGNVEGLGKATMSAPWQPLRIGGGTLVYPFQGFDSETGLPYRGTLTLDYTTYYSRGGGGRPGAAGYRYVVVGGNVSFAE